MKLLLKCFVFPFHTKLSMCVLHVEHISGQTGKRGKWLPYWTGRLKQGCKGIAAEILKGPRLALAPLPKFVHGPGQSPAGLSLSCFLLTWALLTLRTLRVTRRPPRNLTTQHGRYKNSWGQQHNKEDKKQSDALSHLTSYGP